MELHHRIISLIHAEKSLGSLQLIVIIKETTLQIFPIPESHSTVSQGDHNMTRPESMYELCPLLCWCPSFNGLFAIFVPAHTIKSQTALAPLQYANPFSLNNFLYLVTAITLWCFVGYFSLVSPYSVQILKLCCSHLQQPGFAQLSAYTTPVILAGLNFNTILAGKRTGYICNADISNKNYKLEAQKNLKLLGISIQKSWYFFRSFTPSLLFQSNWIVGGK